MAEQIIWNFGIPWQVSFLTIFIVAAHIKLDGK